MQFIAFFKIDKKLVNSNIGYILLNKDKKLHGISSSCIKMLNLDLQKIRRLHYTGINIEKLAPGLFVDEMAYTSKQGKLIDWHPIDYEKNKKQDSLSTHTPI